VLKASSDTVQLWSLRSDSETSCLRKPQQGLAIFSWELHFHWGTGPWFLPRRRSRLDPFPVLPWSWPTSLKSCLDPGPASRLWTCLVMWIVRWIWLPSPGLLSNFLGAPTCPVVTLGFRLTFWCGAASLTHVSELQGTGFSNCLFTHCLTTWTGYSLPAVTWVGLERTKRILGRGWSSCTETA